jgi:tetratricopeptide (TPR) repeat protein
MSYPGNASLAPDIKSRILDTFQQTLDMVESDSLKEAKLGCDFILRLDPMFEPARWLQDRLDSVDGDIHIADLREVLADAVAEQPAAADPAPAPTPETPTGAGDLIPEPVEPLVDEIFSEAELSAALPTEPEAESEDLFATAEPAAEPPAADSVPVTEEEEEPRAVTQAKAFADAEVPEPATAEEVMQTPVAALDTESEQRVHDLLAEGQAALDNGEYQTAIDAWSRIFLIDIDHPEANERIEQARKLKAEAERSVEEAFHEALGLLDRGEVDEARAGLQKVLEMQPDHLTAREQLERLDRPGVAEELAAKAAAAAAPTAEAEAETGAVDDILGAGVLEDALAGTPGDGPDSLATPDGLDLGPTEAVPIPRPRKQPPPTPGPDRKKLLLYVGAAIVALVLGGGWLLSSKWSQWFPDGTDTAATAGDRPDAIERAEALHAEGKTQTALAQLKRLPPHHELYSEAQALIAQWEALEQAAAEDEGPTEADLAQFDALIQEARAAEGRREYLRVEELVARAAAIQPLDEEGTRLKMEADAELEPLRSQMAIFRQGEWEVALRDLWMLKDRMPDNPDLNRLMVDSYYNLGVRALQRGDTSSASNHFSEALALTSGDDELQRVSRFANAYQDRPEDLLYRIFVKYLPFR